MWRLRVKIDVWSKGIDEKIRQRNRDLLNEAYLRLPPWRVWLYLKTVRFMHLVVGENRQWSRIAELEVKKDFERMVDGPEDTIATGKHRYNSTISTLL